MPDLPFQIINILTSLAIFVFVGYYFFKLGKREQELDKKEGKLDTDYHQIVDNALTKERKILEDATVEADQIIAGAKNISKSVRDEVNQALELMVVDIQKEAFDTAKNFITNYQLSLKQLSVESLAEFQTIIKDLKTDLQKQVQEFHTALLPALQTELAAYKQSRMDQTNVLVTQIVTRASAEIMNKAISLEDHQSLVTDSLEKAKKQGAFD
jgi:hypothetical protein